MKGALFLFHMEQFPDFFPAGNQFHVVVGDTPGFNHRKGINNDRCIPQSLRRCSCKQPAMQMAAWAQLLIQTAMSNVVNKYTLQGLPRWH